MKWNFLVEWWWRVLTSCKYEKDVRAAVNKACTNWKFVWWYHCGFKKLQEYRWQGVWFKHFAIYFWFSSLVTSLHVFTLYPFVGCWFSASQHVFACYLVLTLNHEQHRGLWGIIVFSHHQAEGVIWWTRILSINFTWSSRKRNISKPSSV